jgi:phosphate transport system permease protein
VLPNALGGIITGFVLAIGRAAGETAPILFTAAYYYLSDPFPRGLDDQILALPYMLFVWVTEMREIPDDKKWAAALVLVVLTVLMNLTAIIVRARRRRSLRW